MSERTKLVIAAKPEDFYEYVRADPDDRVNAKHLQSASELSGLSPDQVEVVVLPGAEESTLLTNARLGYLMSPEQRTQYGHDANVAQEGPTTFQQTTTIGGREAVIPDGTRLEETNVTHTAAPQQQQQPEGEQGEIQPQGTETAAADNLRRQAEEETSRILQQQAAAEGQPTTPEQQQQEQEQQQQQQQEEQLPLTPDRQPVYDPATEQQNAADKE